MDYMWLWAGAGLVGAILNVKKNRACWPVWLCSNLAFCLYNLARREYAQAALWALYVGLAAWGIRQWKKGMPNESNGDRMGPKSR